MLFWIEENYKVWKKDQKDLKSKQRCCVKRIQPLFKTNYCLCLWKICLSPFVLCYQKNYQITTFHTFLVNFKWINQNKIVNVCNDQNLFQIYTLFYFFRSEFYDFCMGEKLGTHINAPSTYQHYRNGSWSVDQIPINFLVNIPSKYITWQKCEARNIIKILCKHERQIC